MNGYYSYDEIQNMQQKAIERVREMKRNSDAVLENAQRDFNSKGQQKNQAHKGSTETRITNMPPNFPKNNSYPSFQEFFKEKSPKNDTPKTVTKESKKNVVENLLEEPDKALLLGLIMLLKSEGADEILQLALMYIMA